ncbi:MAG: hypothetical protein J3R72DRAFT_113156 [Linnemannia gamsii]|nr:MAG: hypothetical protein J3R72DRAFT_113156 [Linnemannia gamsii]
MSWGFQSILLLLIFFSAHSWEGSNLSRRVAKRMTAFFLAFFFLLSGLLPENQHTTNLLTEKNMCKNESKQRMVECAQELEVKNDSLSRCLEYGVSEPRGMWSWEVGDG